MQKLTQLSVTIRPPQAADKTEFLAAMQRSQALHIPWVKAPLTPTEFDQYYHRCQQENQKSYLVCCTSGEIAGVFNINEIVRGYFQSAYLGFYTVADFAGQGYMNAGLKLVLHSVFTELKLHRLEANIQPVNIKSIQLVQSNGFKKEGYSPRYLKIQDEWRDHERWAITYENWSHQQ